MSSCNEVAKADIQERAEMMPVRKILLFLFLTLCLTTSCTRSPNESAKTDHRLKVIATIYPLYDFARIIGGDKVTVSMLMPPGSDAHHYELKPNDIVRVSKADIFLFTSFEMEHWAYKIIRAAAENTNMLAVETGQGTHLLTTSETPAHDDIHQETSPGETDAHPAKYDPHIWLDFENTQKMVDNIARAFINKDPKNSEYYKANAQRYKQSLAALDKKYRAELSVCKSRTILHAGHWAFAYLAQRYNIAYLSAYNISADAEPSPQQMMALVERIKSQKLPFIFYEDLTAPRLAQTLSSETGAGLLKLSNGHDVSKQDVQNGVSFLTLMEKNLTSLKQGMQCR